MEIRPSASQTDGVGLTIDVVDGRGHRFGQAPLVPDVATPTIPPEVNGHLAVGLQMEWCLRENEAWEWSKFERHMTFIEFTAVMSL